MLKRESRKGQLTMIIIVALAIVAGILIYFLVRQNVLTNSIPADLVPVYNYFDSCIEQQTTAAVDAAGSRGGNIYSSTYDPASDYAPFSSQLNFMGFPVPYWYYISGNGVIKEQVPSKKDIANQIARYIEENIGQCNYDTFYQQGYTINFSKPSASVTIADNKVSVVLNDKVAVSKGQSSAIQGQHRVDVTSKLGKFYNLALEIYNKEKNDEFLENYSVDVLNLYAPVDGVELSCGPKVWKTPDVISEIKAGLEANIAALKFKGGNYDLTNSDQKYFVINQPVDENVNLLYSKSWPTKIDISGNGVDDQLIVAESVGTQQGVGAMGFCYAPYHFVYDLSFPVMVQIYNDNEMFQFPVAVIVDKNLPRNGIPSNITVDSANYDLCAFKTQDVQINVFNVSLGKMDADISYGCLEQKCSLGKTQDGVFVGKVPACLNGYLYVSAENYSEKKQLFSSNSESSADVILDKDFDIKLNLNVGGKALDGQAIVIFSGDKSVSASLPDDSTLHLSEGLYNVSVYVYGNSSITIPASKKAQCIQVAQSGIMGLFGGTKEQCFNIDLPETNVGSALLGGGSSEVYLLADNLNSGNLTLNVDSFKTPTTLDDLQYNYASFEQSGVTIS